MKYALWYDVGNPKENVLNRFFYMNIMKNVFTVSIHFGKCKNSIFKCSHINI